MVGYTGRADNQTITQLLCIFVPVNVVVAHSCTTLGNRSCFSASCDPEICLLPSVGGWKDMKLVSEPLIGNIGASESGRGAGGRILLFLFLDWKPSPPWSPFHSHSNLWHFRPSHFFFYTGAEVIREAVPFWLLVPLLCAFF